jgi:hypothetical protein
MVGNETPCVALSLSFFKDQSESFQKGFSVLVVTEDLGPLYTPSHDVLEEAGSF